MSFQIKCNKCGNEREFTDNSNRQEGNIQLEVCVEGLYADRSIRGIDIDCHNADCKNTVELDH